MEAQQTEEPNDEGHKELTGMGAFSGRIGLPPAAMGWAASCDDGP